MADIKSNRTGYGLTNPLQDLYPMPIIALRAPTTGDIRYPIGQMWVYKTTGQAYMLASVAANSATWSLLGPGASDVDTLTGDSGGAISPVAGNLTIAGGTNITTAGTAGTITANLDAAITLATSVTSPIYASAAGMAINPAVASNLTVGASMTTGAITIGGTAETGTITLGSSSGTNIVAIGAGEGATTVNIAGGATAAKAVNIATGAIAGVVTIGTADGASQMDLKVGTGNFSLDGAATSTYTIGASTTSGTISIGGTAQTGTMTIAGGNAAQTLNVANSTGGKTVNIATGAGANAVTIGSTNTTSATTINSGSGDVTVAGGNLKISTAGKQLQVEGGAVTDFIGQATLTAGTVTILNTNIAATDKIFLSRSSINGSTALGMFTYTISAATSFTITSVQAGTPASTETNDVSIVEYFIVRQL